jgi:1-aminocyclopropane-1-carboxylate deaminase/D-cysteine desulfhydrase-like pyridoxal-dependent ACC family enzyme
MINLGYHKTYIQSHPTPLEPLNRLSDELKIDLKVKRDDLYPFAGGGNKARKIVRILTDAESSGANALVTAGAGNSNHVRVTAVAGARLGWKVRAVIHDSDGSETPNLKLARLAGAELLFVKKADVATAMDQAMRELNQSGYKPYYIWGGGHTLQGMIAYVDAVSELETQSKGWIPDFVIVASGTGGTQAGLHAGFAKSYPGTNVIGVSIARSGSRGIDELKKSLKAIKDHFKYPLKFGQPIFFERWNGGGYEKSVNGVADVIKKCAQIEGLMLDPVYTGKAMKALIDLCDESFIHEGAKVLFWHTGGLMNVLHTKSEV